MGERIEDGAMPPPQSGKRPKRNKYPWDKWFDGDVWRLTRGQDFQVSIQAFRGAAGQAAKRHDLRLTTRKVAENTLLLQALPKDAKVPAQSGPKHPAKPKRKTGWQFWRK